MTESSHHPSHPAEGSELPASRFVVRRNGLHWQVSQDGVPLAAGIYVSQPHALAAAKRAALAAPKPASVVVEDAEGKLHTHAVLLTNSPSARS